MSTPPVSAAQLAAAVESHAFWMSVGLTSAQACGVIASEEGESSFNPRAVGDHHEAFGLMQWHTARVLAILKGFKVDVRTAGHLDQVRACHWEITKGDEKATWKALLACQTPSEAAAAFVTHFERPANPTSDIAKRSAYAEQWYAYFNDAEGKTA